MMAHEFLDDGKVNSTGQQHGGERMAADMGGDRLSNAGEPGDGLEAFVDRCGGYADGSDLLFAGRGGG